MLYKISSMGYFGGVAKVSKGPWFRDFFVEDDGLDWFYSFIDSEGKKCFLLSNNMAVADKLCYVYILMFYFYNFLRNCHDPYFLFTAAPLIDGAYW